MYSSKIENNLTNKECAKLINIELGTDYAESSLRGIYKFWTDGYSEALNNIEKNDIVKE
jgi:hypothetical protein